MHSSTWFVAGDISFRLSGWRAPRQSQVCADRDECANDKVRASCQFESLCTNLPGPMYLCGCPSGLQPRSKCALSWLWKHLLIPFWLLYSIVYRMFSFLCGLLWERETLKVRYCGLNTRPSSGVQVPTLVEISDYIWYKLHELES